MTVDNAGARSRRAASAVLASLAFASTAGLSTGAAAQEVTVDSDQTLEPGGGPYSGIVVQNGATLTGSDLVIDQSTAVSQPAGVRVTDGTADLTGGSITQEGAGAYVTGVRVSTGNAFVTGTTITVNGGRDSSALYTEGDNAEIVADGVTIELTASGASSPSPSAAINVRMGSITTSNSTISVGGFETYGLLASGARRSATVSSTNDEISTSGENGYGAYAFADTNSSDTGLATITIDGGSISTTGLNAYGLYSQEYSVNSEASITASNGLSVTTTGAGAYGAFAHGGTVDLTDVTIDAQGVDAAAAVVDLDGTLIVSGGSLTSTQSAGIQVIDGGSVNVTGASIVSADSTLIADFTEKFDGTTTFTLGEGAVATDNNGTLLQVNREGPGSGGVLLTLGAGSLTRGDIVDNDAAGTNGYTDVVVEEGADWSGIATGVRNFTSAPGSDVSFEGEADIEGDLEGDGTSYMFSDQGGTIGGDVTLENGSSTTGGTIANRISVTGDVEVDETSVFGGNWSISGGMFSSGTVSPGNSIGIVTIGGNYTLNPSSIYEVEVNALGQSDLVEVGGLATLDGAVTVIPLGGYLLDTPYTILTAAGGRGGTTFDDVGLATGSRFITPVLTYDATTVFLTLERNTTVFSSIAATPNQAAAAGALDMLPLGGPLISAVALLGDDDARAAFARLSGSGHASVKTGLIEDSRFVRDAANSRAAMPITGPGFAAWARGFSNQGETDGNGNAAGLDRDTAGLLFGVDGAVSERFRVGVLAGYSHSNLDTDDGALSADGESYHLGVYGGTRFGGFGLRGGLAYSWHELDTDRRVVFPGFSDLSSAGYDARTGQVFGELGYEFRWSGAVVEPFANLAYVNLDTDGFSETGGASALSATGGETDTTFSTIGLRGSTDLDIGGVPATVRGAIGWRHAYDDLAPESRHAFAGGAPFTVSGVPIAEDAAVIEAGVSFALTPAAMLGFSFAGQYGDGASDSTGKLDLSVRF